MEVNGLKTGTILRGKSHCYRIERILGHGSFGITYLAEVIFNDTSMQKTSVKVTIKEFFMKEFNGREGSFVTVGSKDGYFGKYLNKFINEADKLSNINSVGVVKVLEAFQANNTAYYVMQYLSGGSLNAIISAKGFIPERIALQILLQIADALKDLHDKKMLHLDLKPSNVMLSSTYEAVLIDFGLSKQYTEKGEPESSTTIGAGTIGYAPVEQSNYRDGHDFPVTMDIYALGATLFKMLTGIVPPDSSSVLNDGLPKHILIQSNVSVIVIEFIERLMSPMKKSRPQNMGQVISELQSIGSQIHIANKKEVSEWLSTNTIFSKPDEDTEVEIISVADNVIKNKICLDSTIDRIEIRVISDLSKPHDYKWFSVTVTPENLVLIRHKKNEQYPEKKSFFYTKEKFDKLKEKIRFCNITAYRLNRNQHKVPYGIGIKVFRNDMLDFYATSYDDGGDMSIDGKIEELYSLAWKESGLISLDSLTTNNTSIAKILNYFRRLSNWVGYMAIITFVVFTYVLCNPIQSLIKNYYSHDLIFWDNETERYKLKAGQGGTGGVFYFPENKWVVPPHYMRSNPNEVYISDGSFTLDGVTILDQQYDYALIEIDNRTILFFKDKNISEQSYSEYGSVDRIHKRLYKVSFTNPDSEYMSAIYDDQGNVVLPFSSDYKNIIADNVIKVGSYEDCRYYDNKGSQISTHNFIAFYDNYGFLLNTMAVIILSFITCLIGSICYKRYKRRRDSL